MLLLLQGGLCNFFPTSSTASGIITKWKALGTQQLKVTKLGRCVLRHIMRKIRQPPADSIPTELQSSPDINISTKAVYWELHSMGSLDVLTVITVYVIKV